MRILCIDKDGDGALDWLMRCQDDGHEVKWFLKHNEQRDLIGRGLVERVPDWHKWLRWADLVMLPTNTIYIREIDAYRKENPKAKIVSATQASAAWELDRAEGMRVFKKHGIPVPPYREFNNYDAAIAYVKHEGRAFVSKPCGDEPDKALSYVAKSPADLVFMLERWKKAQKLKGAFILQEKIEGTEMAVGGWIGPGGFAEGWCENWEFKKLMNGDLGVATGEQGTVLRMVKKSKLADRVLRPLEAALEKTGHVGYVDVNCIIDEKGTPWPLEFTMRFGWPTFNIQQALVQGDRAEWLADLSDGLDSQPWRLNEVATGVVLSIPDYPYSRITRKEVTNIPLYGLKADMTDSVHPCEMAGGEAPQDVNGKVITQPCLVTAGDYVLVVSGTGETVREARGRAYRTLNRLKLPNSPMWRTDIGTRLKSQLPEIQRHGYATALTY